MRSAYDPEQTSVPTVEPIAQIFIELLPDITVGLAIPSVVALSVEESSPRANQKLRQAQLVVVLSHERDVILEPNGLYLLDYLLQHRHTHFLLLLRNGVVDLEHRN